MKALELANDIIDQLVAWRRDFHMHPELGWRRRTAPRGSSPASCASWATPFRKASPRRRHRRDGER